MSRSEISSSSLYELENISQMARLLFTDDQTFRIITDLLTSSGSVNFHNMSPELQKHIVYWIVTNYSNVDVDYFNGFRTLKYQRLIFKILHNFTFPQIVRICTDKLGIPFRRELINFSALCGVPQTRIPKASRLFYYLGIVRKEVERQQDHHLQGKTNDEELKSMSQRITQLESIINGISDSNISHLGKIMKMD